MTRFTPFRFITALLLAALAAPAAAQTPGSIPDVTAEVWPHPIGDYLPLRVIITNSIGARDYTEGDRVKGGVLHYRIAHLKDRGPLTLRLHITKIAFQAWAQDLIDRINERHRNWPNDNLACPTGSYSPTTVTSGPNWMSPPATVR